MRLSTPLNEHAQPTCLRRRANLSPAWERLHRTSEQRSTCNILRGSLYNLHCPMWLEQPTEVSERGSFLLPMQLCVPSVLPFQRTLSPRSPASSSCASLTPCADHVDLDVVPAAVISVAAGGIVVQQVQPPTFPRRPRAI